VATREQVEKVRQEIMRFRELLDLMRIDLETGERAYKKLFAGLSADEIAGLKEKDVQWKLAETMVNDLTPLSDAVIETRFNARNLERSFEELYDVIITVHPDSD
jgi:hypothetical protein